jgi:hypothetical protein
VRSSNVDTVYLAIAQVNTVAGAERLYWAERDGLCRGIVLRAAARRIEQLGGTEPEGSRLLLLVMGQSLEPGEPR